MEKIKLSAEQKKLLLLLNSNVHQGFNKDFKDDKLKQLAFELKQIGFIEVINYNTQEKPTYITLSKYGQAYFISNAKLKNPPKKLTNNARWCIGILITLLFGILTFLFNK